MEISIEQMLKAGVHFGHQTRFWNPKMEKFIFGSRNKVHIIDLQKTIDCLEPSLDFCKNIASSNNRILFVGTKRSAREVIRQEAERCGMPYVNHRWLGGMLTNYKTIRASIRRYEFLVSQEEEGKFSQYTKKEVLKLKKEMDKLERSIGGIKNMGGLPEALFIVDVENEKIAVAEAKKMGIPIVGLVDTNSDPDSVDYIIPGNDDAIRSISLLARLISNACLEGAAKATGIRGEGDGPVIVKKSDLNKKEKVEVKTLSSNTNNKKTKEGVPAEKLSEINDPVMGQKESNEAKE